MEKNVLAAGQSVDVDGWSVEPAVECFAVTWAESREEADVMIKPLQGLNQDLKTLLLGRRREEKVRSLISRLREETPGAGGGGGGGGGAWRERGVCCG